MSRNVWAYNAKECRLYCFPTKAERTKFLAENTEMEEMLGADSFVQDMRTYAIKWGKESAELDFISPNSPIKTI